MELYKKFKYQLNPLTPNTYMLWYMTQWDTFIQQQDFQKIYFKFPDIKSYRNYREAYQLLDVLFIEFQTLKYSCLKLIAAIFYLLLGKNLDIFTQKQVVDQFTQTSEFLQNSENTFNQLFTKFLKICFAIDLQDILPYI